MQIASSQITMQARHEALRQRVEVEVRRGAAPAPVPLPTQRHSPEPRISEAGAKAAGADATGDAKLDVDPRLQPLIRLIEALTGRPVRCFDTSRIAREPSPDHTGGTDVAIPGTTGPAAATAGPQIVQSLRLYQETEATAFSAEGVVRTADGREISFRLQLSLQRSHSEIEVSVTRVEAQRKDPLVINLDVDAASLTDLRFFFDLDADGTPDALPMLARGSGFLVLDRNGNGRVDDGSELFGTACGNGFADLAALDEDGNGWIDENDAAFARLGVWQPAPDGGGALGSLADHGIGALSTSNLATPFALRGADNRDLGQIQGTGIYLAGNGRAGTLQQVDLSVLA